MRLPAEASGPALLIEGVRVAATGEMLVGPQLTVRLLRHRTRQKPAVGDVLTERELAVAWLLARARTNVETATILSWAASAGVDTGGDANPYTVRCRLCWGGSV